MGLGYNKNALYPRPITLAKDICRFIGVMGIYLFDKNSKFFIFNMIRWVRNRITGMHNYTTKIANLKTQDPAINHNGRNLTNMVLV